MQLFSSSKIRSRCTAILVLTASALVFVGLTLVYSPTLIIPPTDPANPVTVYILSQGYHSRLILPDVDGELVQYTYGDWQYFALNKQNVSHAAAALLLATKGAIGKRNVSDFAELQQIISKYRFDSLLSFEVAEVKATHLLNVLNDRFNRNIDTCVENPLTGLSLVQIDQHYTLFHNSNHELAEWLENLDCEVRGLVMLPNFQVKSPKG